VVAGPDLSAQATARDADVTREVVREEFSNAQRRGAGSGDLARRLNQHTSEDPTLTGGDVDADWARSDIGEEAVGGSVHTPDQDVVEELGRALGIEYEDGEPLHTEEKLLHRDEVRWELNPGSSEDYADGERLLDDESWDPGAVSAAGLDPVEDVAENAAAPLGYRLPEDGDDEDGLAVEEDEDDDIVEEGEEEEEDDDDDDLDEDEDEEDDEDYGDDELDDEDLDEDEDIEDSEDEEDDR